MVNNECHYCHKPTDDLQPSYWRQWLYKDNTPCACAYCNHEMQYKLYPDFLTREQVKQFEADNMRSRPNY